ncbi:MAG: putative transport system substrate-binding protein, partial [Bryobacterales bacterium]|nr:putative transport system substrate-binding protein [Bryobacterales bacterium]
LLLFWNTRRMILQGLAGHMKRRHFITLLGGAALLSPLAARAQQQTVPMIGYLSVGSPESAASNVAAFREGLKEAGYVEGKNLLIEYRWGEGQNNRLPALATELVRRRVAVIVSASGTPSVLAAKAATATIPIVFSVGTDPIAFGLVASLNKPGGNLTGVTSLFDEVASKRLELAHELMPAATIIALLVNPTNPNSETQSRDLQEAARKLALQLHILRASTERDLDAVFATVAQLRAGVLLIGGDAFFGSRSGQIAALAVRHAIPTISFVRSFATAGGLMSYGGSLIDADRLVGVYTGRILKGEKPADLPVQQSTKVELIINLKTAKMLGIAVPPNLLVGADEVIE